MKLIVLTNGINYTDWPFTGNHAMIINHHDGRWVLITVLEADESINTCDYGRDSNQYGQIRTVLRDALEVNPHAILLDLCGEITLQYMEKPIRDHFGDDVFNVEISEIPVDFPRIGY